MRSITSRSASTSRLILISLSRLRRRPPICSPDLRQNAAQETDYVLKHLVLVDLVEHLVLCSGVDVLLQVAATQAVHSLPRDGQRGKDVPVTVDPERRQVAETGPGSHCPHRRENSLQCLSVKRAVVDELITRVRLANRRVTRQDGRIDWDVGQRVHAEQRLYLRVSADERSRQHECSQVRLVALHKASCDQATE